MAKNKNTDFNKRMKVKEFAQKANKKQTFIVKDISVQEILDESGEVSELTIIKLSFEGILIHLSVGAGFKLLRKLKDILENWRVNIKNGQ